MKVDFFVVSEGAFCHDGSFTIVGMFDTVKANSFPYKLNVGIALKMSFNPQSSWEENFKICIYKKGEENEVYSFEGKMPEKQNGEGKLALVANIQGLVIPTAGIYNMVLFLGEKQKANYEFKVIEHGK